MNVRASGPDDVFDFTEAIHYDYALTAEQAAEEYETAAIGWVGEQSGEHVKRSLDVAMWPRAKRDLDVGNTRLQASEMGTSVTEYISRVTDSEQGSFYVKANGDVRFRARHTLFTQSSQAVFGDTYAPVAGAPDDGIRGLPILDYTTDYSDNEVLNIARVSRENGIVQEAVDLDSIRDYQPRTYERLDGMHDNDQESVDAANWIVANYSQPLQRVKTIVIDANASEAVAEQAQLRELEDRITVKYRYSHSPYTYFSSDHFIQSIGHEFSKGKWKTTFGLSSVTIDDFAILDDAVSGVLDTVRLGY
jgi:hypothetical protein